jgi:hypothetical protein
VQDGLQLVPKSSVGKHFGGKAGTIQFALPVKDVGAKRLYYFA